METRYQYQFGTSEDLPDKIENDNGTYLLVLNQESRDRFHQEFCAMLEYTFPGESSDSDSDFDSDFDSIFTYKTTSSIPERLPEKKEVITSSPAYCNPKGNSSMRLFSPSILPFLHLDLLGDVRNLSKFIKQGRAEEAAELAAQLASQEVRLEAQPSEQLPNEEEFP